MQLTCSTFNAWSMVVFSHLRLPRIDHWVGSLRFHPKPLTVWGHPNQYRRFPEHGSHLCPLVVFSFCPRFSSSPRVWLLGTSPFQPCFPSNAQLALSASCASKITSISWSGPPRGYFDLPRSLHGPRSAHFDRDPHCSTLATIATSLGCFWSLVWILRGLSWPDTIMVLW